MLLNSLYIDLTLRCNRFPPVGPNKSEKKHLIGMMQGSFFDFKYFCIITFRKDLTYVKNGM